MGYNVIYIQSIYGESRAVHRGDPLRDKVTNQRVRVEHIIDGRTISVMDNNGIVSLGERTIDQVKSY